MSQIIKYAYNMSNSIIVLFLVIHIFYLFYIVKLLNLFIFINFLTIKLPKKNSIVLIDLSLISWSTCKLNLDQALDVKISLNQTISQNNLIWIQLGLKPI